MRLSRRDLVKFNWNWAGQPGSSWCLTALLASNVGFFCSAFGRPRSPCSKMPAEADLAELWLQAPTGRLAPKEQLRAVALRDAMQEFGDGSVNYQWIANKLTVGGGGSPSREAVRVLLLRVDGDSDWYPVKSYQEKHGPAPLLSPAKAPGHCNVNDGSHTQSISLTHSTHVAHPIWTHGLFTMLSRRLPTSGPPPPARPRPLSFL